MRATSHARVGGGAEVSVGDRVEVRRGLGRARVRLAPAGPLPPTRNLTLALTGLNPIPILTPNRVDC